MTGALENGNVVVTASGNVDASVVIIVVAGNDVVGSVVVSVIISVVDIMVGGKSVGTSGFKVDDSWDAAFD